MEKRKTRSGKDCRPDWHVRGDAFVNESQSLLINVDCGEVQQYFILGNLVELGKRNAGTEPLSFKMVDNILL